MKPDKATAADPRKPPTPDELRAQLLALAPRAVVALRRMVADPKTDATTRGKAKALLNSPRVVALIKRLEV